MDSHFNGPFEQIPQAPTSPWLRRAVAPFENTVETVRIYGTQKEESPAVVTATCSLQRSAQDIGDGKAFSEAVAKALRLRAQNVFVFDLASSGPHTARISFQVAAWDPRNACELLGGLVGESEDSQGRRFNFPIRSIDAMKWEPFAQYMGALDVETGPPSDKSPGWGDLDRTCRATLEISKPIKAGVEPDFDPVIFGSALAKALGEGCLKAGCGKVKDTTVASDMADRMAASSAAATLFNAVDKNHDGHLSHSELKKHLQNAPWALPFIHGEGFHWADLFAQYDTDNDGHISEAEFVRLYHQKLLPLEGKVPLARYQVYVWAESCNRPRQVAAKLHALAGKPVAGFTVRSVTRRGGHHSAY